jgi:hypothetical protein
LSFTWAGAIWVAGELGDSVQAPFLDDVWGSFDFGRSWHQPAFSNGTVVNLPGIACTDNNRGVLYNDAVYLVGDCSTIGSAGYGSNDYWTYVSRDPAQTSWTRSRTVVRAATASVWRGWPCRSTARARSFSSTTAAQPTCGGSRRRATSSPPLRVGGLVNAVECVEH